MFAQLKQAQPQQLKGASVMAPAISLRQSSQWSATHSPKLLLRLPPRLRPGLTGGSRNFATHLPTTRCARVIQNQPEEAADELVQLCEEPFSVKTVLGLIVHQKLNLLLGVASAAYCTLTNLGSPLLAGLLFDILVSGRGAQEYGKVCA